MLVHDNGSISNQWEKIDYSINAEASEKNKVKPVIHNTLTKI